MIIRSLFGQPKNNISINYEKLQLITPCKKYWQSFAGSYKEYRAHKVEDFGYPKVDTQEDFEAFLRMVEDTRLGINLQRGFVQTSMFWLVDDVNYFGSGSVRHYLTENLKVFGGHIGYSIRPEVWGKGLGTIQLRFLLEEAKKVGITTARLTCYEANVASQKVMIKNGGRLIGRVVNRIAGKDRPTFIYEIDLTN